MQEGICKYCGKRTELIQSHIIPKSFYNLKKVKRYLGIHTASISLDKTSYQNGYKEYLLCSECDGQLGRLDECAKDFLFNTIPNSPFRIDNGIKSFIVPQNNYNYSRLHYFFISLAWRISISKHFPYHLPYNYEALALRMLKYEAPANDNMFFPIIWRKNVNSAIDHCITVTENYGFNQKNIHLKIPSYEIIIVPDIDMFQSLESAIYKQLFTRQGTVVLETENPTYLDIKLLEQIYKFKTKNNKK